MSFRISGLPAAPFVPLFALSEAELRRHRAVRRVADRTPGFPCRVSLRDADPGETVLLVHFEHQPADTPYRAGHAIYVREGAGQKKIGQLEPGTCFGEMALLAGVERNATVSVPANQSAVVLEA